VACLEQLHLATARRALHVVAPLVTVRAAMKRLDHAVRRMRLDLIGRAMEAGNIVLAVVASVACWGSIGLLLWALCG
jgi:hypothetical protein